MSVPLPDTLYPLLRCPSDHGALERRAREELLSCKSCGTTYPVRAGVPVLINTANSLFSPERLILDHNPVETMSPLKRLARSILPTISLNVAAEQNCRMFGDLLLSKSERPVVLVIGSGDAGQGMRQLLGDERITFLGTDVYFGTHVNAVADGHDLPFAEASFDGAICQAVLEHVLEPHRCVAEIHRVLKPGGLVYAETPFMQQVHGGPYDFTRFSLLGHRRLFRDFRQEAAGTVCGPGMALLWSIWYFLRSFSPSPLWHRVSHLLTACAFFWLKYFDRWLTARPAASDAASGVYFLGTKSDTTLEDRDLIELYWSTAAR